MAADAILYYSQNFTRCCQAVRACKALQYYVAHQTSPGSCETLSHLGYMRPPESFQIIKHHVQDHTPMYHTPITPSPSNKMAAYHRYMYESTVLTCAQLEIPTVAVFPSNNAHSCDFVYLYFPPVIAKPACLALAAASPAYLALKNIFSSTALHFQSHCRSTRQNEARCNWIDQSEDTANAVQLEPFRV